MNEAMLKMNDFSGEENNSANRSFKMSLSKSSFFSLSSIIKITLW